MTCLSLSFLICEYGAMKTYLSEMRVVQQPSGGLPGVK